MIEYSWRSRKDAGLEVAILRLSRPGRNRNLFPNGARRKPRQRWRSLTLPVRPPRLHDDGGRESVMQTCSRGFGCATVEPGICHQLRAKWGMFMKRIWARLLGVVVLSAAVSSATAPAFALGGCGPNQHRGAWGRCVWGGQNQEWCLRHTGHPATRMPDGTMRCIR